MFGVKKIVSTVIGVCIQKKSVLMDGNADSSKLGWDTRTINL